MFILVQFFSNRLPTGFPRPWHGETETCPEWTNYSIYFLQRGFFPRIPKWLSKVISVSDLSIIHFVQERWPSSKNFLIYSNLSNLYNFRKYSIMTRFSGKQHGAVFFLEISFVTETEILSWFDLARMQWCHHYVCRFLICICNGWIFKFDFWAAAIFSSSWFLRSFTIFISRLNDVS